MALVLDTGVIYAALDENDADHERCAALIASSDETLVIPSPVLVELDYWLRKNATVGVWVAFAEDLHSAVYALWPANLSVVLAASRLQSRFADQNLGFVDATVFCSCEALGERKVATLDRRHFGVLRTADGRALDLLPDVSAFGPIRILAHRLRTRSAAGQRPLPRRTSKRKTQR